MEPSPTDAPPPYEHLYPNAAGAPEPGAPAGGDASTPEPSAPPAGGDASGGAPRKPGAPAGRDAAEAERDYAATLKEWGDTPSRLPILLGLGQVINPAKSTLDSADNFPAQVTSLMNVFKVVATHENLRGEITFSNVSMRTPMTTIAGVQVADTPYEARAGNRDYAAPLHATATLEIKERAEDGTVRTHRTQYPDVHLGDIPQIVRARNCSTSGMTGPELEAAHESATDPGGYVILKGNAYAIRVMESLIYNLYTVHIRDPPKPELVQGQVISKPGDAYENSAQLVIRVLRARGAITAELAYKSFAGMQIPFRLLFSALGVTSDSRIVDYVLYDATDESAETQQLKAVVGQAIRPPEPGDDWAEANAETDPNKLQAYLGWRAAQRKGANTAWQTFEAKTTEADRQRFLEETVTMLNEHFLPHVGLRPPDYPAKLMHLGYYIRMTLLVLLGVKSESDRESYTGKRCFSNDVQWAKEVKTRFNLTVVRPLRRQLSEALRTTSPERIMVRALVTPLLPTGIATAISMAIVNAERNKNNSALPARMSTERITWKNGTSGIVAIDTYRTPGNTSKQTIRADLIRRVHGTYPGSVCPTRSADSGEQVGMNKGRPVATIHSRSSSSSVLQQAVASDPEVVPLQAVDAARGRILWENLTPVMVNGLIVGYTARPYALRARYVEKRRRGEIDRRTTVAVEPLTGEVLFYVDIGRPLCPYVIIDNNRAEVEAARDAGKTPPPFDQWPRLRAREIAAVLSGATTMEELEECGRIEYLSIEEVVNCLVAPTVEELARERRNETKAYTHMYLHPAGVLSLAALMSVYLPNSEQARGSYQTQQAKSSQGVTFTTPRYYFERTGTKQQTYVHMPMVSSLGYAICMPAGQNAMAAVLAADGFNLEDSCTLKRQAVERGFFNLHVFTPFEYTIDKSTRFADPLGKGRNVASIDESANFEYLGQNGIITVGAPVEDGTVLIGVLESVADAQTTAQAFVDRSVIYRGNERGVVVEVIAPQATRGMTHCKVVVLFPRHVVAGDKIAARSGNKAIVCKLVDEWDLPFSADGGVRPDVVFNPLSFPSRMVINQLVEAAVSLISAARGTTADATAYNSFATEGLFAELLAIAQRAAADSPDPESVAFSLFGEAVAAVEKYSVHDDDVRSKFSGLGTTVMIDPNTGAVMRGVTMTPLFVRRLAKFAAEDAYAVREGAVNKLNKQPTGGKKKKGGMRLGEMERQVLLAQGAMRFFSEKMFDHSSGQPLYICARCQTFTGFVNESAGIWGCPRCGADAAVQAIQSDACTNILQQSMHCLGAGMRVIPRPAELPAPAGADVASGDMFALDA